MMASLGKGGRLSSFPWSAVAGTSPASGDGFATETIGAGGRTSGFAWSDTAGTAAVSGDVFGEVTAGAGGRISSFNGPDGAGVVSAGVFAAASWDGDGSASGFAVTDEACTGACSAGV